MRPRSRRTWRRRLGALVVVVLIGDGAAGLAIHRDHQRAAAHPAAPAAGPPPGCSAVVLPPPPAVPVPVSESTAKADAVALRGGAPVAAASARAMAVLDYLSMCGEAAPLLSGSYRSVWVVTVRVTTGPYTAVIDADHNKVVGACEGTRCSNIPPGS